MEELQPQEPEELVQELEEASGVEETPSPEVEALLRDLEPERPIELKEKAVKELGELTRSTQQIVEALSDASMWDPSPEFRRLAAASLLAPAHQAVVEQHPELLPQYVKNLLREMEEGAEEAIPEPKRAEDLSQNLRHGSSVRARVSLAQQLDQVDEGSLTIVQVLAIAPKIPQVLAAAMKEKARPMASGAVVGGVVGLYYGAVLWIVGPTGSPDERGYFMLGFVAGPIGAITALLVGAIAGAIAAARGDAIDSYATGGRAVHAAARSLVGGAIGSAFGPVFFMLAQIFVESFGLGGSMPAGGLGQVLGALLVVGALAIPGAILGAIFGAISGLMVSVLGVILGGALAGAVGAASIGFFFLSPGYDNRLLYSLLSGLLVGLIGGLFIAVDKARGSAVGMQTSDVARSGALGAAIGGVSGAFLLLLLIGLN